MILLLKKPIIGIMIIACLLSGCGNNDIASYEPALSTSNEESASEASEWDASEADMRAYLQSLTSDENILETPEDVCRWFGYLLEHTDTFTDEDTQYLASYDTNIAAIYGSYSSSVFNKLDIDILSCEPVDSVLYEAQIGSLAYAPVDSDVGPKRYAIVFNNKSDSEIIRQGVQLWVLNIEIPPYSDLGQYEAISFIPDERYQSMVDCREHEEAMDALMTFMTFCSSEPFSSYNDISADQLIRYLMSTNPPAYIQDHSRYFPREQIEEAAQMQLGIDIMNGRDSDYYDMETDSYRDLPMGIPLIENSFVSRQVDNQGDHYFYYRYMGTLEITPLQIVRYTIVDHRILSAVDVTEDFASLSVYHVPSILID